MPIMSNIGLVWVSTCFDRKQKKKFNLPGTAIVQDLVKKVKPINCEIYQVSNRFILAYGDDCRIHNTSIGNCKQFHTSIIKPLIYFINFNILWKEKKEKKKGDHDDGDHRIQINTQETDSKQICTFTCILPNGDPIVNSTFTICQYRTVVDLYRCIYRLVFGSSQIHSMTINEMEKTVGIIMRGKVLDPLDETSLTSLVYPDHRDINSLVLVIGSSTVLQKQIKPKFDTCTGGTIELVLLQKRGIVKSIDYFDEKTTSQDQTKIKEKKETARCAHCLAFFKDQTTDYSIVPTQINCIKGHPVHVECLVPNTKLDEMKRMYFTCHLCQDRVESKPSLEILQMNKEIAQKQLVSVPKKMQVTFKDISSSYGPISLNRSQFLQVLYDYLNDVIKKPHAKLFSLQREINPKKTPKDYPGLHLAPIIISNY